MRLPASRRALLPVLGLLLFLAGLPLALAQTPEAAPTWSGNINAAFDTGEHRWAGPFPEALEKLAGRFGGQVDRDLTALPADRFNLLYGDPATHPALAAVLAWHHVALDAGGITLGQDHLAAADPFLIAALPMPGHPDRPVLVYTAWSVALQPKLNTVFHGPTPLVLGHLADGKPVVDYAGSYAVDREGRLTGLGLAPGELSGAEAVEDLHALVHELDQGYAGLEDLDAALVARGSSWTGEVAVLEARFEAQDRWTWAEVTAALRGLLDPVLDTHFTLEGAALGADGTIVSRKDRLSRHWEPWFAETRLREEGGQLLLDGQPLGDPPPPVPDPAHAALGVLYRFPTLPEGDAPGWLLGELVQRGDEPEAPNLGGRTLTLHRADPGSLDSWDPFTLRTGEVPVLEVRTMVAEDLAGLADTATALRKMNRIILDLRFNGGGSDQPAMDWFARLGAGRLRWTPGGDLAPGEAPRAARWTRWGEGHIGRGRPRFHGALEVLIDGSVASSGETFVQLAAQLPSTRLYGQNTAGCSRFGNLERQAPLPHSGLVATFGHTRFDWDSVRPVVEGRGIFPDVWLDEPDPIGRLRMR